MQSAGPARSLQIKIGAIVDLQLRKPRFSSPSHIQYWCRRHGPRKACFHTYPSLRNNSKSYNHGNGDKKNHINDTITTVTPLPPKAPSSHTPTHHIGSPPTSFQNPWLSYKHSSLFSILAARWSSHRNHVPIPSPRPQEDLPSLVRTTWHQPQPAGLKATWIGHATWLLETTAQKGKARGVRLLTDPVWSSRVGPYSLVGPVRFSPLPCSIAELPPVDAVLISHDHYDHLDVPSLRALNAKQNGQLRIFCALGVKKTILGFGIGIREDLIVELDWWDRVRFTVAGVGDVTLACTPGQHNSGRTLWGFQGTLWCSWVVKEGAEAESSAVTEKAAVNNGDEQSKPKTLFFAGDTGYCHTSDAENFTHTTAPTAPCPAFRDIGRLHGPMTLSLLPIGCFKPRQILSAQHSSPEDALAIHADVRSERSLGMHYGTFRGTLSKHYEPVEEPVRRWKEAARERGLRWGKGGEVGVCELGETVVV